MKAHLIVCRDPNILNAESARRLHGLASEAIQAGNRFTIALSGGSTPARLYSLLAEPDFGLPWESVHLFWGDERCVPPDHAESNYRMADEALISRLAVPAGNVHRMRGELRPDEGARAYDELLAAFFSSPWPRFDLVLLGIGEDGHTASLFPGSSALREASSAVAATYVERLASHRLTLTPPAINNADNVVFLVSGESKAAILREVIEGEHKPFQLPAQLVRPDRGQLTFIIDLAAARMMHTRSDAGAAVVELDLELGGE